MKRRCIAKFGTDPRMPDVAQCSHSAKEGSDYCGKHDPAEIWKRRVAADAKYLQKMKGKAIK